MKQKSRAIAKKLCNATAVCCGLILADIHYNNSSQAAKVSFSAIEVP